MINTKYLYSYDVVRTDVTPNPVIAKGLTYHDSAKYLAQACSRKVPDRTFEVKKRRKPNPAYTPI